MQKFAHLARDIERTRVQALARPPNIRTESGSDRPKSQLNISTEIDGLEPSTQRRRIIDPLKGRHRPRLDSDAFKYANMYLQ